MGVEKNGPNIESEQKGNYKRRKLKQEKVYVVNGRI